MRDARGFVNHSLQLMMIAFAIWVAAMSPLVSGYAKESSRHRCALRVDAAAENPMGTDGERTCAISGAAFTVDGDKVCDPSSTDRHRLTEPLCASAADPSVDRFPPPAKGWRLGVAVGLAALFLIGLAFV